MASLRIDRALVSHDAGAPGTTLLGLALTTALAGWTSGCATAMEPGRPEVRYEVLRTESRIVARPPAHSRTPSSTDAATTTPVSCVVEEVQTQRRRSTTRMMRGERAKLWWPLSVTGALLAVGGGVMIADAAGASDAGVRRGDGIPGRLGRAGAGTLGAGLLAIGAGTMTFVLVDNVRFDQTIEETSIVVGEPRVVGPAACTDAILAEAALAGIGSWPALVRDAPPEARGDPTSGAARPATVVAGEGERAVPIVPGVPRPGVVFDPGTLQLEGLEPARHP